MILFLLLSFPASYIIDTYGIKTALRIGAVIAGISAICKAVFAYSFTGVVMSQIGLTPEKTYSLLLISSFIVGFFVMSAGPIGFQYAAEVSYPVPESASQGMLLWVGQLSGMIFVGLMSIKNNEHLGFFMSLFAVLTLFALAAVVFLQESPMIRNESNQNFNIADKSS